ncbi:MAG: DNA mismatch repair endonuclease MutL [Endomicrobiales bacterium]|nr:DNA mismatch repair endonuclease MutL [Endomicrobiales bacterium]
MTIHILSEETINKIAAGEVIERPSNVVKELIENSIDAEARSIEIEIKGAGKQLIRVRDDGNGMTREEITLSVARHATSKISSFNDLENLDTLGFRGEALPSISAVSHLLIQSQPRNQNTGWEEKYAGGKLKESRTWSGAAGTTVEASRLFFNTPVRDKFLKSDFTEKHHIIRTIEEIALANPHISFKVIMEGKVTLNTPGSKTHIERIIDILGDSFAKTLIPVEANHPQLKLKAFITKTENSLNNRNSQFLFINGRPINFSRSVTHSIYEAYRENLPSKRHPGVVIYLETNPNEIDVNIHPTKREVRFSKEKEIHQFILKSLKDALIMPVNISLSVPDEVPGKKDKSRKEVLVIKESYTPFSAKRIKQKTYGISDIPVKQTEFAREDEPAIKSLGQVFGTYIVALNKNELLIIDQHAACERIRYERYLSEWESKKIPVQPLLIPLTLDLSPSQIGLIRDNLETLTGLGWDISEFGTNTVRITAQPNILGTNSEVKDIINEIIQALVQDSKLPLAQKTEKIIRAACRASIKANDPLSAAESNQLLKDLFKCRSPYTCPHGRPTMIRLSQSELNKKFNRN